jgi:hypothetical protein
MRKLLTRLALFASSFALVFALVGIRLFDRNVSLACAALIAALVTIVVAALLAWYALGAGDFTGRVTEFDPRGESMAGYLVGYVLPIILVEPRVTSDVIAVGAFVVILSLTYAAADLHYLNPLLPLLGFRVWAVSVRAPDRPHRFVAIGWRMSLEPDLEVQVLGDGPVRFIRAAQKGKTRG